MKTLTDEEVKDGFISILIRQYRRFRYENSRQNNLEIVRMEEAVSERLYGNLKGDSHGK